MTSFGKPRKGVQAPTAAEKASAEALAVAQLRRRAACTGSLVARAGYLALADAIEKASRASRPAR